MTPSCMNCGAMLMQGTTVCPVCQQPVAPAPGASGWPQQPIPRQPVPPTRPPWQQPGFGPPPGAYRSGKSSNAGWFVAIGVVVLVMLGGIGGLIFFTAVRRPSSNYESYNYNRPAASSSPYVYNANSEPPPSAPGARNRNSPKAPISGGVLNGKATSLPKPAYPAIARAAHASGTVTVQVTVDESGKVISARAVSGHPLLQAAAVQAAYGARFSPTLLSGQPVKVTGVLTYNFVAE